MFTLSRQLFGLAAALFLVLAAILPALPAGMVRAQVDQDKLSKQDRELLAQVRADGKPEVTLLIASQPGVSVAAASGIAALGGNVRYQNDLLGYVRAVVPTDRVEAVAKLAGIQAVNLDRLIPLPDPLPADGVGGATDTPLPSPGPRAAAANPFLPARDIGAPDFIGANPTYDGRGVKIGIIDTGVDLFTPELQTAMALDGTSVPKFADWVTSIDPLIGNDPTWIPTQTTGVLPVGGQFTVNGVTYVAPSNGVTNVQYRFGIFNERDPRLAGELRNDVNRDGNPPLSKGTFPFVWDTASNTVWVDTNQNGSFADEKPMTDYRVKSDVGTFGTPNPLSPVRTTVPFVIQTDLTNNMVNIGIVSGFHGTHVAGIAAGKGLLGGAFNGVAPEAQLVSVRACLFVGGCPLHAVTEGAIYAVTVAKVDILSVSLGRQLPLSDGSSPLAALFDRLVGQYGVQIVAAAGNSGSGIGTINDPSTGTKVLSVGAYVQSGTLRGLLGVTAARDDGLFAFSSRGPRADGGFKPDLVAPGAAVSTIPGWRPAGSIAGGPLPAGYAAFAGTSMAAPQAAGGAALLLSAARQSSLSATPDQLRQAISSSARYLGYYGAHEQGAGLMHVGAAWGLLQAGIQPVQITSSARVSSALGQGPGLYEREGWAAGQGGERTITFTRTSGPAGPVTYNLSFTGNDGTFSTGSTLTLPLNAPTTLSVGVRPMTSGVHSAILNLVDPATAGIAYRVLNTVVAAEQMTVLNNFATSYLGQVDRADSARLFLNVPAGAGAMKVEMKVMSGSVRATLYQPDGLPVGRTGYCSAGTACEGGAGTISRTVSLPGAGVWEVALEGSARSAASPAGYTLRGSLLGVSMAPAAWVVDPAPVGTGVSQAVTFTNRFAAFTGGATGTDLGSAFTARPTIAQGAQQTFTVDVPALSTLLTAKVGNPSDTRAQLALSVLDPAGREVNVPLRNPSAGIYTVVVAAISVPAGSTQFDYEDYIDNAAFGRVSIADAPAPHPFQSVWMGTASVTPMAAPSAGRYLRGHVQVMSGGAVISSAAVELRNVR